MKTNNNNRGEKGFFNDLFDLIARAQANNDGKFFQELNESWEAAEAEYLNDIYRDADWL